MSDYLYICCVTVDGLWSKWSSYSAYMYIIIMSDYLYTCCVTVGGLWSEWSSYSACTSSSCQITCIYAVLQWMACGLNGAHTPPVHHHVRLLVYMLCYSGWFVVQVELIFCLYITIMSDYLHICCVTVDGLWSEWS